MEIILYSSTVVLFLKTATHNSRSISPEYHDIFFLKFLKYIFLKSLIIKRIMRPVHNGSQAGCSLRRISTILYIMKGRQSTAFFRCQGMKKGLPQNSNSARHRKPPLTQGSLGAVTFCAYCKFCDRPNIYGCPACLAGGRRLKEKRKPCFRRAMPVSAR